MPEGDTIFRTAALLRRGLSGQQICDAAVGPMQAWPTVDAGRLRGRLVTGTEARGKHLLIHLDDQQAIHSHLGMTGSWHVYRPGQTWQKPARRAALVLHCTSVQCVCFTPKTLELLSATALRRHAQLAGLGPDLLGESCDLDQILVLLRRQPGQLTIGEAVMDQRIVAGIGNVYKSELLFLERINPLTPIERLDDDSLRCLLRRAQQLMRRNLDGQRRATRFGHDGQRLWVYGRSGEKCLECGTTVRMQRQGQLGRSTYWCPICQPPS